jgi:hypothetical protein
MLKEKEFIGFHLVFRRFFIENKYCIKSFFITVNTLTRVINTCYCKKYGHELEKYRIVINIYFGVFFNTLVGD